MFAIVHLLISLFQDKNEKNPWLYEETIFFIDLMKEENVVNLMDGNNFRTKEIFQNIGPKFQERGYKRTTEQLITKFRRLKTKYSECQSNNNKSGRSRKTFEFYDAMKELLDGRPIENYPAEFGVDSSSNDIFYESKNRL